MSRWPVIGCFVVVAAVTGCRRSRTGAQDGIAKELEANEKARASRWSAIDVDDGIDANEALTIAERYFDEYLGACGGPALPTRDGRYWTSVVHFGVAGRALPTPIKVDAKTGGVQGPDGPTYASFA